jgi:hypothetical protein
VVSLDSAPALVGRVAEGVTRRVLARLRVPDFDNAEVRHLRWLRNLDIDLVYSFTGYIHPSLHPLRHVLLMPDIQHEYFPEFFSAAALAERRKLYSESAHRADHICAISEFTRQTLIDTLGVDGARVTTIPLAADADFSPVVDKRRRGVEAARARARQTICSSRRTPGCIRITAPPSTRSGCCATVARPSPRWSAPEALARRSRRWPRNRGGGARRSRPVSWLRAAPRSAGALTGRRRCSSIRRSSKGSASRSSKRWRAGCPVVCSNNHQPAGDRR